MSNQSLRLTRRSLIAGAGSLLAAPSIARAQANSGVALVIGNSKYKWESSLPNVKRDAPDVAKRLQDLGLDAGGMTPDELTAKIRDDIPKLGKIVRDSGAKVD